MGATGYRSTDMMEDKDIFVPFVGCEFKGELSPAEVYSNKQEALWIDVRTSGEYLASTPKKSAIDVTTERIVFDRSTVFSNSQNRQAPYFTLTSFDKGEAQNVPLFRVKGSDDGGTYFTDKNTRAYDAVLELAGHNLSTEIVLFCGSDSRANRLAVELVSYGFSNIYVVDGGTIAWADAGYPYSSPNS